MLFKLIFPLLTDLFRHNPFHQPENNETLEFLKKALRKELGSQILKIFGGLILTSIIIICIAKLATALSIYIDQFQNSAGLQLVTFGVIALLSTAGLIYLFVGDRLKKKMIEPPPPAFDIQSLLLKFTEGVMQGFEKNRPLKEEA